MFKKYLFIICFISLLFACNNSISQKKYSVEIIVDAKSNIDIEAKVYNSLDVLVTNLPIKIDDLELDVTNSGTYYGKINNSWENDSEHFYEVNFDDGFSISGNIIKPDDPTKGISYVSTNGCSVNLTVNWE